MVPGAFGGEFRDKEKMSGDGKLARFFAKKMAGDVYEFQVWFRNRAKKSVTGNSMLFRGVWKCSEFPI